MCIIIVKNEGVKMPSDDIINRCWKNNPDGAGYMFRFNNQVYIRKGFMFLGDLKRALRSENFKLKDEVIIHFRIGTSGKNNQGCTHPFPLSKDIKTLKKLNLTCNKGVAHNGIIGTGEKKISDTMVFIKDVLSDGIIHNNLHRKSILELITDYLGLSNKLAIMDRFGVILLGNKWIGDEKTDLWFSNDGYKIKYVRSHYVGTQAPWARNAHDFHYNDDYKETDAFDDAYDEYMDAKKAPYCPVCVLNEFIILDEHGFYNCENCDTIFDADYHIYDDEDVDENDEDNYDFADEDEVLKLIEYDNNKSM